MADKQERADAFLRETRAYIGALDEAMNACACGHAARAGLSALSVRSLAPKVEHIHATVERLEQRRCDDEAGFWKHWVGRSILSTSDNIDFLVQYCPKVFIFGRIGSYKSRCWETLARSFFGAFTAGGYSLPGEGCLEKVNSLCSFGYPKIEQFNAAELNKRRTTQPHETRLSPMRQAISQVQERQWKQ